MNRQSVLVSVAILLAISIQAKADFYYNVVDLGTVPGCTQTRAYSVNNAGQVVGYGYGGSDTLMAIQFDSTGNGNAKALHGGGIVSFAYSINNRGQVAGRVGWNAVVWGTPSMTLGVGDAYCINDSGQVVGATSNGATLFDTSGSGNHLRLGSGEATYINALGQVVGLQNSGFFEATLFDITGQGNNVALGGLPGYSDSFAFSINNSGQIVGGMWVGRNPYTGRAVLFDTTGGGDNIDLGRLPLSSAATMAYSINNRGQIVGWAVGSPGRAVLFDPTGAGNNIDLNLVIDPSLGWELWQARSINDNGWIAGIGRHEGYESAFLLVPVPAPGAALLGVLGLVYSGWRLRRRTP